MMNCLVEKLLASLFLKKLKIIAIFTKEKYILYAEVILVLAQGILTRR